MVNLIRRFVFPVCCPALVCLTLLAAEPVVISQPPLSALSCFSHDHIPAHTVHFTDPGWTEGARVNQSACQRISALCHRTASNSQCNGKPMKTVIKCYWVVISSQNCLDYSVCTVLWQRVTPSWIMHNSQCKRRHALRFLLVSWTCCNHQLEVIRLRLASRVTTALVIYPMHYLLSTKLSMKTFTSVYLLRSWRYRIFLSMQVTIPYVPWYMSIWFDTIRHASRRIHGPSGH